MAGGLCRVREADGLPVILKTPMAPAPGPSESERYRREFSILQRLLDVRGVARPYACERIHERPVLLLEKVQGESRSYGRSSLHGGLERWFEPMTPAIVAQPAWPQLLRGLAACCFALKAAQQCKSAP